MNKNVELFCDHFFFAAVDVIFRAVLTLFHSTLQELIL